jgi:hypothetical protein
MFSVNPSLTVGVLANILPWTVMAQSQNPPQWLDAAVMMLHPQARRAASEIRIKESSLMSSGQLPPLRQGGRVGFHSDWAADASTTVVAALTGAGRTNP